MCVTQVLIQTARDFYQFLLLNQQIELTMGNKVLVNTLEIGH
jgi:hypothetical protein